MEKPTPRIVFSEEHLTETYEIYRNFDGTLRQSLRAVLDCCARIANEQLAAEVKPVFEVGKRYRTRDGAIAGPLMATSDSYMPFKGAISCSRVDSTWRWRKDGFFNNPQTPSLYDLQPGALEDKPAQTREEIIQQCIDLIDAYSEGGTVDDAREELENLRDNPDKYKSETAPSTAGPKKGVVPATPAAGGSSGPAKSDQGMGNDEWTFNVDDSAAFIDALENPQEPNKTLKDAASRYKDVRVKEDIELSELLRSIYFETYPYGGQSWIAVARKAREIHITELKRMSDAWAEVVRKTNEANAAELSELRARCERAEARIEKFREKAESELAQYRPGDNSYVTTYKTTLESVCRTLGLTILPAVPAQALRVIKAEDE